MTELSSSPCMAVNVGKETWRKGGKNHIMIFTSFKEVSLVPKWDLWKLKLALWISYIILPKSNTNYVIIHSTLKFQISRSPKKLTGKHSQRASFYLAKLCYFLKLFMKNKVLMSRHFLECLGHYICLKLFFHSVVLMTTYVWKVEAIYSKSCQDLCCSGLAHSLTLSVSIRAPSYSMWKASALFLFKVLSIPVIDVEPEFLSSISNSNHLVLQVLNIFMCWVKDKITQLVQCRQPQLANSGFASNEHQELEISL